MLDQAHSRLFDVRKLARKGASIAIEVPLADLPRVQSAVVDGGELVAVNLVFDRDEDKRYVIRGSIKAELSVLCQRCLEPMPLPVTADVALVVAWDDAEVVALPKHLDGIVVGEEPMDLLPVIEDELLLALPIVSYHDPEQCSGFQGYESADPEVVEVIEKRENPFDILDKLKNK